LQFAVTFDISTLHQADVSFSLKISKETLLRN